ncbi:MAG: hypothetical protein AAFP15_09430 [Bacteroidota bacterium]
MQAPDDFTPVIQTRRALFNILEGQMRRGDDSDLKIGTGQVKTAVVEVDGYGGISQSDATAFVERTMRFGASRKRDTCTVTALDEEGFFQVIYSGRKSDFTIWVDTLTDPRYWLAFTLDRAEGFDRLLDRTAEGTKHFDRIWLWPQFLEREHFGGVVRGFGLWYDYNTYLSKLPGGFDDFGPSILKMQIWGGRGTWEFYEYLRQGYQDQVILSRILVKKRGEAQAYADENLSYAGKFVVKGNDFSLHHDTLNQLRTQYRKEISRVEAVGLGWTTLESGAHRLEGYAINIVPEGNFRIDVQAFKGYVFSGAKPFRLVGLPAEESKTRLVMDVVDLHMKTTMRFEIYPDLITIYLKKGQCGNSIARFYTNLQHYFGARFSVEADNGERFFDTAIDESISGAGERSQETPTGID